MSSLARIVRVSAAGLVAFLVLTTLSSRARAWGPIGHETVAHLAERNLTSKARARVAELLGPRASLASIATWADDVRKARPETKNWHFIDIENDARTRRPDVARFCPEHDCVVDQIDMARQRLVDEKLTLGERSEALKFLVHFVGDLHQPLHCADDDDRGGNEKLLLV
ncbi:MAG TPA: S1/P1 nuclease, partial [Polyangiaceae bacterium]|nr:S1/P1 nuclease [Polyangiaceae bacterium]